MELNASSRLLAADKWIKTDPKKAGMFDGWTVADLKAEKEKLKRDNKRYMDKDQAVPDKNIEYMAQLNFAIRAKEHNL